MSKTLYLTKKVVVLTFPHSGGDLMNFGWGENTKIRIYKGFKNRIEFVIRNHDRIPVNTTKYRFEFRMFDNVRNELLLVKNMNVLVPEKGKIHVDIDPSDLTGYKDFTTFKAYVVAIDKDTGIEHVLYTDYSTKNYIFLELDPSIDPEPVHIQTITEFHPIQVSSKTWFSTGPFFGPLNRRYQSTDLTIAIYMSAYTGTIFIEATNDPVPHDFSTDWTRLEIEIGRTWKSYVSSTGIDAFNIVGNYSYVRVLHYPDPFYNTGEVLKVVAS